VIVFVIRVTSAVVNTTGILLLGRAVEKYRWRNNGLTPIRRLALRFIQFGEWLYGNWPGQDLIVVSDSSFAGAARQLIVNGEPQPVYYAMPTVLYGAYRNPRDLRPTRREPEAEDSDSQHTEPAIPGLESPRDGPLDSGNARHMAMVWPEAAAGPPRHMFGRPSLANAELQARHDREYRELLHQEVRQPAVRGVFRNNVRIIRRPRPVARLVFQGNVERHFDQEVAGWHAAANEPDSPRTRERCLCWAFIEAARALEEFAERQAVAPTSHQDDNGEATVSNPEVVTEGDAPANVADDAHSENRSDGDSQTAAVVHLLW
jgi:hypothetical protein